MRAFIQDALVISDTMRGEIPVTVMPVVTLIWQALIILAVLGHVRQALTSSDLQGGHLSSGPRPCSDRKASHFSSRQCGGVVKLQDNPPKDDSTDQECMCCFQ